MEFPEDSTICESIPIPLGVDLLSLKIDIKNLCNIDQLPPNLIFLNVSGCDLVSLANLPITLQVLNCESNNLVSLPDLPNGLRILDCSNNKLEGLPTLPKYMTYMTCHNNELVEIPELSKYMSELNASHNKLTSLPDLKNLRRLNVNHNCLEILDIECRGFLEVVECENNMIKKLVNITNELEELYCDNNLVEIVELHDADLLNTLSLENNGLKKIISLPETIKRLFISNNPISNICCKLPDKLEYIDVSNTNISYLDIDPKTRLIAENAKFRYVPTRYYNADDMKGNPLATHDIVDYSFPTLLEICLNVNDYYTDIDTLDEKIDSKIKCPSCGRDRYCRKNIIIIDKIPRVRVNCCNCMIIKKSRHKKPRIN
jgi:hypothetical protein